MATSSLGPNDDGCHGDACDDCNWFWLKSQALLEAAKAGHFQRVKELLKSGADVNWRSRFRDTAVLADLEGAAEIRS